MRLHHKGHFARAAEKFGAAAAAAVQELAAEDCLVVALLRAFQAESLSYHSTAPTLTVAEADETCQTVMSVLLPQCMSTLTRRKAAGTLLPGSCRAAEVTWFRVVMEGRLLRSGASAEVARKGAKAAAPTLGVDAYMLPAAVALSMLFRMKPHNLLRELQLSHAAFVASALDVMAQPRELPIFVDGRMRAELASAPERMLARIARLTFPNAHGSDLDHAAVSLMVDAWRRFERSGALVTRSLGGDPGAGIMSVAESHDAAAAEAAVRGLHACALAGCAAKEVHVSQFKRCGACRTVAYCCREHQLADWPAHKAACKAARENAAGKS